MKNVGKNVMVTAAKKVASIQVNSCCVFWMHQPKQPKELKQLRKF